MQEGMTKLFFAGFIHQNEVCKVQDILTEKHRISDIARI